MKIVSKSVNFKMGTRNQHPLPDDLLEIVFQFSSDTSQSFLRSYFNFNLNGKYSQKVHRKTALSTVAERGNIVY